MAEHHIALNWERGEAPFTYEGYSRNHAIRFKNEPPVIFSTAVTYKGDPSKGDPEDLLVAALSSCHMLSFLAIAARKKLTVESYEDDAVGFLENDNGRLWVTRVILRPKVVMDAGNICIRNTASAGAPRACNTNDLIGVTCDTTAIRGDGRLEVAKCRHHHHRNGADASAKFGKGLNARHARQANVEDQQIRRIVGSAGQAFLGGGRNVDEEPFLLEQPLEAPADRRFIVHDQDSAG